MSVIKTDICIIGAGAGGLSVAAGAAQMGAKVVLIEKTIRNGVLGGDCLHTGCVPSKALLAAAKAAYGMRHTEPFGVEPHKPAIDFAAVHAHVHGVIDAISPIDTVSRFEHLGVKVIEGTAEFTGPREVEVNGDKVRAKFFCLATGSTPAIPPIEGLTDVPYLTNETIFDLKEAPAHLIIIGGGPIGAELAQAHRRLGVQVSLLEASRILPRDDPEMVATVREALAYDGVDVYEGASVEKVSCHHDHIEVAYTYHGAHEAITGSHLLIATGRKITTDGLGLEAAGIKTTGRGIEVDARLRTTNKRIFAIGDAAGGPQFTHVAGYHAGIAIRNMLYRMPAKADHSNVPHVTYTDPELAHVGLTQEEAEEQFGKSKVRVIVWDYSENDRAQAERRTAGEIKLVTNKKGEIHGVTIVGAEAGELLAPWILARSAGLKLSAFAGMIAPYPTLGELSKRVAGMFYTPFLFGTRNKLIVRTLMKLP